MRNKATIGFVLLLTFLITPLMSGCQSIRNIFGGVTAEDGNSNQGYSIYYISTSENSLGAFPHKLKATKEMDIINECLDALRQEPSDSSFRAVLGGEIDVIKTEYSETEKTLGLYLPREYKELSKSAEILERAAIVKTLTQFGGIVNYVSFCVDDEWIKDSDGSILKMSDGDYVSKINLFAEQMLEDSFTIYFAAQDGKSLKASTVTMKYEVSAKPEEMLLDALIRGPSESSGGAVLSKNTQIRSIYTKDGICTVDFNQAFLEKTAEQNFNLNVYSVVNTLCSLEQIDRVYINVDGASVENAPDGIDLSRELTPDMSLVTK